MPSSRPDLPLDRRGCSFEYPICVWQGPNISNSVAQRALEALERAYERIVVLRGLPQPIFAGSRTRQPGLDLYLLDTDSPLETHAEPIFDAWDRAASYCTLGAADRTPLARAASLCIAEAIAHRLDASETPHTRRAFATHVWWSLGEPTALDAEAVDDVQRRPERAPVARELSRHSEGSALFFEYIDAQLARTGPSLSAASLLALSANRTPASNGDWNNEPDTLDVLRHSFDRLSRFASFAGDFAVARAFVGVRDVHQQLPSLRHTGDFGRVRFDWVIPFSSLPRRVAISRALEPLGASYLWLELDRVPKKAELAVQAECEAPAPFTWQIVRVARDGHELSRVRLPFQPGMQKVEQRLVEFEGADGLLIVGVNLGGLGVSHPFDPDVAPYEPHRCTVYLAQLVDL